MLNIERKLLLWVEKNMLLLLVGLAAAMGLYLRKTAVWWGSPDVGYYFDSHGNNVQSAFYYLLVRMTQYVPALPLHSVKWLAGLADYGVAALCLVAVGGHRGRLGIKSAFYFVICLLSPVAYLRGICWAQVDSLAFAFLLGALVLWERGRKAAATALGMPGVALYPCFLLLVFGWLILRREERGEGDWLYFGILAAGSCLLGGISSLLLGQGLAEGLWSYVRWISYDPCLGTVYKEPLSWVKQMGNLFGYGAAMAAGIAAYRHWISYGAAILVHLAVLLVYGSLLFPVTL